MTKPKVQFGRVPTCVATSGILRHIRPMALRAYVGLCGRANRHWQVRVSIRKLAIDTGCYIGAMSVAVRELSTMGLIVKSGKCRYEIITDPPTKCSQNPEHEMFGKTRTNGVRENQNKMFGNPRTKCSGKPEPYRVIEQSNEQLAATPRRRDLVFEAIAGVCGLPLDQLTKSARGQLNKATAELCELKATPDDVRRRADVYRAKYPRASLTPSALTKHWPALADNGRQENGRVSRAELDTICPLVEPTEEDFT